MLFVFGWYTFVFIPAAFFPFTSFSYSTVLLYFSLNSTQLRFIERKYVSMFVWLSLDILTVINSVASSHCFKVSTQSVSCWLHLVYFIAFYLVSFLFFFSLRRSSTWLWTYTTQYSILSYCSIAQRDMPCRFVTSFGGFCSFYDVVKCCSCKHSAEYSRSLCGFFVWLLLDFSFLCHIIVILSDILRWHSPTFLFVILLSAVWTYLDFTSCFISRQHFSFLCCLLLLLFVLKNIHQ